MSTVSTRRATATLATVDRAVAVEDWQAAYDASMSVRIGGPGALKRLLTVAEALHHGGASDAALDLLDRGVDAYAGTPRLYAQLADVFVALDREDDAQLARELLEHYSQQ